jgi:hypothetical protein
MSDNAPLPINDPSIETPESLQAGDRFPLGRTGGDKPLVLTLSRLFDWLKTTLNIDSIIASIAQKEPAANKSQQLDPASQTDFPTSAAVAAHVAAAGLDQPGVRTHDGQLQLWDAALGQWVTLTSANGALTLTPHG